MPLFRVQVRHVLHNGLVHGLLVYILPLPEHHPVGGGMAIRTQGDQVVGMVRAAAASRDDVVNLDVLGGVAQGAAVPVPPVDGLSLCVGELG